MTYLEIILCVVLAAILFPFVRAFVRGFRKDWNRRRVTKRAAERRERARAQQPADLYHLSFTPQVEYHDGWLDPENPICPGCKYCAKFAEMSDQEFEYKEQN